LGICYYIKFQKMSYRSSLFPKTWLALK
jgi:hypothetical protein